jgi:hypothetical protein
MTRLVQLRNLKLGRRVAVVNDNELVLLDPHKSIYALAAIAMASRTPLAKAATDSVCAETLSYDEVYEGKSEWKLMPAFDHAQEPARCFVTGTGLTHRKSAENRQAMHGPKEQLTDSMKMYQWGLEGGRPQPGKIGVAPEWFYKGCGTILRAHGEPLEVPNHADDGGEEAEVAGVYLVDPMGTPRRLGFVLANEFSDHVLEEKNYLYLAPSKLRTCSIGPELIVDGSFDDATGTIRQFRNGNCIWTSQFRTGEKNMSHTVANLEHHHFKHTAHRRPGDAHIHFFGADVFSFGEGVRFENGDVMEIELPGFGRALRNPIKIDRTPQRFIEVKPL